MKINKEKYNKILNILVVLFIIGDLIAIAGLVVMYGPWKHFQNLYVTTAMKTMNHQYLAYVFYTERKVEKIMDNNYFVAVEEDVNLDDIIINTGEKETYKDEYEKELLTREPDNDLYKVLNIKVGKAKGYLVAIYEPQKVRLIRIPQFNIGGKGQRVMDMCQNYGGILCVNGGGFANGYSSGSDIPMGYVIDDNQVVWAENNDYQRRGDIIGLTVDGKLKLMSNATGTEAVEAGIQSGIEFGPFLIVNGKSVQIYGTPFGIADKSIIAQRQDGVIMFLVADSGANLKDVVKVLEKYGAYNAANLDGGNSASLIINNQLMNSTAYYSTKKNGGRRVVTGFGLIP